jgi:hypothetical protein
MTTQAGGMVSRREEDFYPDNRDESFLGVAASRGLCIFFLSLSNKWAENYKIL